MAYAPAARGKGPGRPGGREDGGGRPRRWGPPRRKVCRFCVDRVLDVDYKNTTILRNFVTERGKMISARSTGNCSKHHRMLTRAIKRARNLALLPFAVV
ncbi:MAG TPA: 30S ribosomal protein S18 [Elusimicrobiota bacterium]|nr:30S ribosomal protein S18 [Elusimicrobiota bacterium]